MSIRYKFRSSANFDSVDIEGRPSISVRELRASIVRRNKLNLNSQNFVLVLSDAVTGQEYNDEDFQIPSGSTVIVKRLPAGSVPSPLEPINSVGNLDSKDSNPVNPIGCLPLNADTDNFHDFGVDFFPVPEAVLCDSDMKRCSSSGKPNNAIPGCRAGFSNFEASELSEDPNHNGTERNSPETKVKPNGDSHKELDKMVAANYSAVQNNDFPSEFKCPLCNAFFKDAVMIPCCQHSFCEKCIHDELQKKAQCPKCFSCQCKVENLLPNLCLRQAIKHFLTAPYPMSSSDNALDKYAPDGESGIHAKNFSCDVNARKSEPYVPLSPSANEKGSNQIMADESWIGNTVPLWCSGFRGSNIGASKALKSASHKLGQIDGEQVDKILHVDSRGEELMAVPDFQGENQPHDLPQSCMHEEVDSGINPCMSVMLPKLSFSCANGGVGSGLAVNPNFCFVFEKNGHSLSPSSSRKISLRLSKSAIVTAKKNDKKSDAHSFAPKPDEATGPFPEALLLKEKKVQEDGRLLPEFADAEEQELFEQLNLQLESDLKVEQMRHYEVVYLIHENCVKEVDNVNTKVQDFIKEKNGKIWRFSDWGLRRLGYQINKAKKAHYILMNFELAANWINDFKNMLDKDERVIRHLVMKRDRAETEDCPPPPEFHTLRAGIDDDDDYNMDGDYDDEDGEGWNDEGEDDEGEIDMVGNDDDTHEGIIYVDDFIDEHSESKDSNKKSNVAGSKGRMKQKAKPVSR